MRDKILIRVGCIYWIILVYLYWCRYNKCRCVQIEFIFILFKTSDPTSQWNNNKSFEVGIKKFCQEKYKWEGKISLHWLLWIVWMCFCKYCFPENVLPQCSHLESLWPSWIVWTCVFKYCFPEESHLLFVESFIFDFHTMYTFDMLSNIFGDILNFTFLGVAISINKRFCMFRNDD